MSADMLQTLILHVAEAMHVRVCMLQACTCAQNASSYTTFTSLKVAREKMLWLLSMMVCSRKMRMQVLLQGSIMMSHMIKSAADGEEKTLRGVVRVAALAVVRYHVKATSGRRDATMERDRIILENEHRRHRTDFTRDETTKPNGTSGFTKHVTNVPMFRHSPVVRTNQT